MLMNEYLNQVLNVIDSISRSQKETIQRVASKIADSIMKGGVLHLFGSGHSHMVAEDAFNRAGGLVCINAMLEPSLMEINVGRTSMLERLHGYAKVIVSGYDLRPGETIIIVSNSGINAVPIEVALECKERGLHVVALTSLQHSSEECSRHSSGKRLFEVADEVLDNCGVPGDAMLAHEKLTNKIGPSSTIAGIVIIQTLICAVVEQLLERGAAPPVFRSGNISGGEEHNQGLIDGYKERIRYY
ncbi:sugar isomerase domain-containing protein [Paenibacillus nasutitermitis]|uniref:UPF0309 protein GCM10010911_20770 n=1 Tax=Paenibacillus nasutitermitis TaxID=1652958 RepID=A0A916YVI7_9BACL|nr:SIS domain-containing protein [Paenibacillus nasutitermitis]GGD62862.1 hypothetical protein GCM10010911_20770 [Paenibacillus nasutitermitis]